MFLCNKPGFKGPLIAVLSPFCIYLDIAGEQVHALLDTGAARSLMAEKNKYLMCLKLGCLSLLWPSGLVCKFGGTFLPVIGDTEVKLMVADALPILVTKDFPHELLIGSDAISRGNGEIDYGTRKVTSFGQNFSIAPYTDFILHTAIQLL